MRRICDCDISGQPYCLHLCVFVSLKRLNSSPGLATCLLQPFESLPGLCIRMWSLRWNAVMSICLRSTVNNSQDFFLYFSQFLTFRGIMLVSEICLYTVCSFKSTLLLPWSDLMCKCFIGDCRFVCELLLAVSPLREIGRE